MDLGFRMHAERTPNPNSIKWVLSSTVIADGNGAHFSEPPLAEQSPLAAALFGVPGVAGVFLGSNFLTVTKTDGAEWTDLAPPIVEGIKTWAGSEEPALGESYQAPESGDDDAIVTRIKQILEDDIRPFVAQDGGDITFAGFQDGVVEVYLQGACAGCPSSTITLKMGIESRLKEVIPEVREVVSL
jgi:Fe-S cluster biogenesis protein NfuA